eukprot:INCI18102.2.p1 GENE.INCI18102.2~~INCI18102.2.p1  ORF type:complete len:951 (-),score=161.33 INCI18102.2:836-3688(-)
MKWFVVGASVVLQRAAAVQYVLSRGSEDVDLFATFDRNFDGIVTHNEFFHLGRDLHSDKTMLFVESLWKSENRNGDEKLTFEEFTGPKSLAPLSYVFDALDHNEDQELDLTEYTFIVPESEHRRGPAELWHNCNSDNDAGVSLPEFIDCVASFHDITYEVLHQLRLQKLTALVNVALDSRPSDNSTYLAEIDDAMQAATRLLESGKLSFSTDPNFAIVFEHPIKEQQRQITVPIVYHLMELYARFKVHSIRQLLLLCLRAGVNPQAASPWTLYSPPPLLSAFWKMLSDTELIGALLDAGHSVDPLPSGPSTGLSLLHICFFTTEVNIVKKLFVIADQYAISAELEHNRKTVAEIFQQLGKYGHKRSDWQGDLYHVEYKSLLHSSPTFASLVADWNKFGPTDFIDRSVSHAINEEASLANFRLLLSAGLDITEIAMQQPTDGWNIFHLLTHFHYARCVKLLFNEIERQCAFTSNGVRQSEARRAIILRAARRALQQTDSIMRRTPAHFAAAFFGNTSTLAVLEEGSQMVDRLIRKYDVQPEASAGPVMPTQDVLGNIPARYADGTASNRIPRHKMPSAFFQKATSHNALSGSTDKTAINEYHKNQNAQSSIETGDKPHFSSEADGGWGEHFGIRSDLESTPPGRCDIIEVATMPSKAEWAELVMAGQPFVVRNGAEQLGLRRHLWERETFLETYGTQPVRVGKIPYQRSFASDIPRDNEFQHNPMDDIVNMSDFISSFHDHGGADTTGIPNYLFTTKFTTDNPSLMESCAEAFEFAMDVGAYYCRSLNAMISAADGRSHDQPHCIKLCSFLAFTHPALHVVDGINVLFEGQFYLGPPASGAPAHWHSAAINVMAFGKKRWALFPPHNGSFYSIKPSVDFFKWDVPEMEALGQVLHFTQNSGDILCVPKGWGHATLNIQTSIGIAFEFSHAPTVCSSFAFCVRARCFAAAII